MFLLVHGVPSSADDSNYQVGAGDVLRVNVYDNPDLSTTVRVSSDGKIQFPLIGEVFIGKMNVSQVADTLAKKLANGYIINPQVSVFIEEFRSKRVVIIGPVATPGLYELSGPTTLLELISKAGGLTEAAGDTLTIKRKATSGKQKENLISVNLKELLERGDASMDIPVLDGDTVHVSKAGLVYVTGQVKRPNAYLVGSNGTVLKAITMAGGFTTIAAESKIKIIRKEDGVEKVLKRVPLDTRVQYDDVIVVPESFF